MIEIRALETLPVAELRPLAARSELEGFRFLRRMLGEWETGEARFDGPGEVLLGAFDGPALVGIGGLTVDPYGDDPATGRLRHLYVAEPVRNQGVGRGMVRALEEAARGRFRALVLRTDTAAAARFYEALGYAPLPPGGTASHRRELDRGGDGS
jgi:hypothetical protein